MPQAKSGLACCAGTNMRDDRLMISPVGGDAVTSRLAKLDIQLQERFSEIEKRFDRLLSSLPTDRLEKKLDDLLVSQTNLTAKVLAAGTLAKQRFSEIGPNKRASLRAVVYDTPDPAPVAESQWSKAGGKLSGGPPAAPLAEPVQDALPQKVAEELNGNGNGNGTYAPKAFLNPEAIQRAEGQFTRLAGSVGGVLALDLCVSVLRGAGFVAVDEHNISKALLYLSGATDAPKIQSQAMDTVGPCLNLEAFAVLLDESRTHDDAGVSLQSVLMHMRFAFQEEARNNINGHRPSHHKAQLGHSTSSVHHHKDCTEEQQAQQQEMISPGISRKEVAFQIVPAIVILINSLVIGASADNNPESFVWTIFEILFSVCFTLEFVAKLVVYGVRDYFCGPEKYWNLFDFSCLMLPLGDLISWAQGPSAEVVAAGEPPMDPTLVKIFRLAKLGRMVRLLRFRCFDELKTIILGVFSGMRVLFWAILLLMFVTYILGIVMQAVVGPARDEFRTVPASMFSLFRCFTDGCSSYTGTPLQEHLREQYGAIFFIGYILVFLFVTIGIFNLIMAIFIDNVTSAAAARKQRELGATTDGAVERISSTVSMMIEKQKEFMSAEEVEALRENITEEMFATWLEEPEMVKALDDIDIDTSAKKELFAVVDVDMSGSLSEEELISGLMMLRGPPTKCDVIAIRLKSRYLTTMLMEIYTKLGLGEEP